METLLASVFQVLSAALLTAANAPSSAQGDAQTPPENDEPNQRARIGHMMSPPELDACFGERGVRVKQPGATPGYTLVMPLNSRLVHLVDLDGKLAHTWSTGFAPGGWCYLLDDGSLLHCGRVDESPRFRGGGIGGELRRLAPDGSVLWRYDAASDLRWQHHDVAPLQNGNVLFIAWERIARDEAIARGRNPATVGEAGLWADALFEVRPTLPEGGEIVWEWHVIDHLVQDVDPAKPEHAKLAERPGRIDVNAASVPANRMSDDERKRTEERGRQMAALGYGGEEKERPPAASTPPAPGGGRARGKDWSKDGDWLHTNAVAHHAGLDLLVLSSPELGEVFVIDHATTTAEARTSSGGRRGQGGDLLWRWGNPLMHGAGTKADTRLFFQHDPTWIDGADGSLRLLVFNNGGGRPGGDRSSVDELVLPFDRERGFSHEPGRAFGPVAPVWTYESARTFFSAFVSGARRLASGNTLITSGAAGRIFEVTPAGEIVWDFANPHGGDVEPPEHAGRAPPLSLYRAARYASDHPGIQRVLADRDGSERAK